MSKCTNKNHAHVGSHTITLKGSECYLNHVKIVKQREDDEDFLEYRGTQYPCFKVARAYYYGGMKKKTFVPVSTPDRAIIEANQVRQGYSHLTWNTINSYYL